MKSADVGFKSEHLENIANLKPLSADLILLNVLFLKTTDKGHPTNKGELALHTLCNDQYVFYSRIQSAVQRNEIEQVKYVNKKI